MNPYVEPALIAAGVSLLSLTGTVGVAIASFRNTRNATTQTVEAGTANTVLALDAARRDRLWDRQAPAYVDAIAGIRHMQTIRETRMQTIRLADPPDLPRPPVDWTELEARVLAFASPAVIEAFQAASDAGRKHSGSHRMYVDMAARERGNNALRGQGFPAPDALPPGTLQAARKAAEDTLKEAGAKDDALIALIRTELHGKPSHTGPLPRSIDSIYQPPDH